MKTFLMSLAVMMTACGGADDAPVAEGDVAIELASATPVRRGSNTFSLTTAADATSVAVSVWMPSMGHGAPNEPSVVKAASGSYRVEDVTFSMPGTWELKVNVTCPSRHGTRAFRFEVP